MARSTILVLLTFYMFSVQYLNGQDEFNHPIIVNKDSGLPSNTVSALDFGPSGYAWLGTPNGLARYDGNNIKTYTYEISDSNSLASNFIHDVASDSTNNRLWIGHAKGLSYLNYRDDRIYNYKVESDNEYSIVDSRVVDILIDRKGIVWIAGAQSGILRYRPETDDFFHYDQCLSIPTKFEENLCEKGVYVLSEDPYNDDILFFGAKGMNIFNKSDGTYEHYSVDFEDPKKDRHANIPVKVIAHENGLVYYGTWYYGVFVFDPKEKTIYPLNPKLEKGLEEIEMLQITDIIVGSDGHLWVTATGGFTIINLATNTIVKTYKNKEKSSFGASIIDEQKRIWLKGSWHGLQIFNPLFTQIENLRFVDKDSKYASFAMNIVEGESGDKLYVAAFSGGGLYIYHKREQKWENIPPPKTYDMASKNGFQAWDVLELGDGSILILEDEHLYYYKEGFDRLKKYPLQLPNIYPRYRSIRQSHKDTYWITSELYPYLMQLDTEKGVIEKFDQRLEEIRTENTGLFGITEDSHGNFWFLDFNAIILYETKSDSFYYHRYQNPRLKISQTFGCHIDADDKGNVWIASRKPLLTHTNADLIKKGEINIIDHSNGLQGNSIMSLRNINEKLIIYSDEGIQVFNKTNWKFDKKYDKEYKIVEPLLNNTLMQDKRIAVGNKGFISINPKIFKVNEEIPKPYLTSFSVFDEKRKLNSSPSKKDSLRLSYKQNFFSFEYSSIAYNLPEKVRYECKLEGFDDRWYDGTERKFKSYTNVPGGEYTFKVRAINNEGLVGMPAELYLFVSTVWWKTTLFWVLSMIALFVIGYLLYKWRINAIRKEERLKSSYEKKLTEMEMSALRAQMNPHFIFNAMNSIDYYIISNEQEKASDYLNRFSRLIRLILQNSKSTVVPLKDDLEALQLYIEIESMRFDDLFDYEILLEDKVDSAVIEVPPMILQPYVENSIWHGLKQKKDGKGKLEIKIRRSKGAIVCTIEDNGIGRKAAENLKSKSGSKRKSFGMKITKGRLEALNQIANTKASVHIFDLYNEDKTSSGTRVEIVIPI